MWAPFVTNKSASIDAIPAVELHARVTRAHLHTECCVRKLNLPRFNTSSHILARSKRSHPQPSNPVSSIPVPLVAEPKARKWDSFASSFNPCPLETIANWNASTTFKYQCGCFQRGKPQLTSFKHSRQQIARRSIPVFFLRKIIYLPQSSWYTKMFPPLVCLHPQSLDPRRSQVDNCNLYWRVVFLILGNSFLLFSHLGVRFIWKRWAGHRWKWLQLGGWVEDEG